MGHLFPWAARSVFVVFVALWFGPAKAHLIDKLFLLLTGTSSRRNLTSFLGCTVNAHATNTASWPILFPPILSTPLPCLLEWFTMKMVLRNLLPSCIGWISYYRQIVCLQLVLELCWPSFIFPEATQSVTGNTFVCFYLLLGIVASAFWNHCTSCFHILRPSKFGNCLFLFFHLLIKRHICSKIRICIQFATGLMISSSSVHVSVLLFVMNLFVFNVAEQVPVCCTCCDGPPNL